MRLFWSTLVVLAFAGVHSYEISLEVVESLLKIKEGEDLYAIQTARNRSLVEVEFAGGREKSYSDFISDLRRTDPSDFRTGIICYTCLENKMPPHMLVMIIRPPKLDSPEKELLLAKELMSAISKIESFTEFGIGGFVIATKDEDLIKETLLSRLTSFQSTGASELEGETTTHAVKVSE